MKLRTSKRIAAVTLALLAAAQLAGCNSDDKPKTQPSTQTPPGGGDSGGGTGGGGGNGGGGDTGGGDSGGGDSGGGDSGGGDSGGGGTPGAMAEGFFVDAAVAGLTYTTSSNLTGVTDAEGRYEYREGDTVTFSLGELTLGTVAAQGIVTPVTVAQALASNGGDVEAVTINLLTLLQSLDSNGNPDDGITFTPEIRAAVTANAIDLTAAQGAFTSSLTNLVSAVASAAPEATLSQVTPEEAVAHFESQAPTALAGHYVAADASFAPISQKAIALTIFRNGRYLLGGQHDRAACNLTTGTPDNALAFSDANGNGVEYGSYSWNPLDNQFEVTGIIRETDGSCGLNVPIADATNDITVLEPHAKGLVFKDSAGNVVYRFARMQRQTLTLAGGWVAPTALLHGQPFTFTFFPSTEDGLTGRYLMVDASIPNAEYETSPGIEEGCYSVDANDRLTVDLTATCADAVDTNDTAGASSNPTDVVLFIDENDRLVIADAEGQTGFTRLPTRAITHEAMAGAWIIQSAPDVAPADEPNLRLLTVFEDGRFLFGTQEDDPSCTPADYPTQPLDLNGNGVEYGTLSLTANPGLVVPANVTVDTNGECGLYHNGKTGPGGAPFQQAYLIAPNEAGDALVVWANDEEDPSGIIFKRVPSVPNQIWGAWYWTAEDATADQFAISVFLQGGPLDGVMFEAATLPDNDEEHWGVGIRRESFSLEGSTLTSWRADYEYCVDTQGSDDECAAAPGTQEPIVEDYPVNGDFIGEEEDGIRRIPGRADP